MQLENDIIETTPGMGAWRIKDNDGGGKFNYDVFGILQKLL
jgi:hypothetical protein